MKREQLLLLALNTAPVKWGEVCRRWITSGLGIEHFPPVNMRGTMDEAITELDWIIDRLVRFREYLNKRHGYGCGDQGHRSALSQQNRTAAKVRRALGYTYPKQYISFSEYES